jgi:hypothetical protein
VFAQQIDPTVRALETAHMIDASSPPSERKVIVLWGPPAIDWLNVRHSSAQTVSQVGGKQEIYLTAQPGGIALLCKLLDEMRGTRRSSSIEIGSEKDEDIRVREEIRAAIKQTEKRPSPLSGDVRHTWSLWEKRGRPAAYRMSPGGITNWERGSWVIADPFSNWPDEHPPQALLILDDPGKGPDQPDPLKSETVQLDWVTPKNLKARNVDAIILRLNSRSMAEGRRLTDSDLFALLDKEEHAAMREMTTVLTTVRNLRANGVRVGASLSWERMLDDVVAAARECFKGRFGRVIITIGLCGAVVIEKQGGKQFATLVFDRYGQELDFESEHEGRVLGSSTCLLAALATSWREGTLGGPTGWPNATRAGLAMMRTLSEKGYLQSRYPRSRPVLEFPIEVLRATYYSFEGSDAQKDLGLFSQEGHGYPKSAAAPWTILEDSLKPEDLTEKAKEIVRRGVKVLQGVPVERVEKWYSADRSEIEGVRSVRNAIRDYLQKDRKTETKPLSIAVFGPPGAGKSFVVQQIAKREGVKEKAQLTFNLSQYESPAELAEAFHQARDMLLNEDTPLVFWDEFDSFTAGGRLGWLRHFLSPMQDGQFIDRGKVHPVGRGVYIFAGGTKPSFAEFIATHPEPLVADEEKNAKKPDFISRLRAYIDVKGPNPTSKDDSFWVIRRAFLLRSCLEKYAVQIIRGEEIALDDGVLNAFLMTRDYRHGARSMENIVRLSDFAGKTKFELSSLPPEHLLEMHVPDVRDFMKLVYTRS